MGRGDRITKERHQCLLKGLVRCGDCQSLMTPKSAKSGHISTIVARSTIDLEGIVAVSGRSRSRVGEGGSLWIEDNPEEGRLS